ncbi:MAG: adenylyl-sulfate kinase [Candidatus Desulfofervidus auxilii]|nr:adenylyl-sulfate kinase [Candidatus Desulfofervidus auxilii]
MNEKTYNSNSSSYSPTTGTSKNDSTQNKNIYWQKSRVSKEQRTKNKGHRPAVIWFTGIPGSGKTTISRELEEKLCNMGVHTYLLDGDNIRHGLCKDLGFSKKDRDENIRRVGEVAKLFVDAGIIVICAFASPYKEQRKMVRNFLSDGEFIEVFVKCPLEICIQRDPKGLYKKAFAGEIKGLTGLDDPYEEPESPEITLETDQLSIDECVNKILDFLKTKKII